MIEPGHPPAVEPSDSTPTRPQPTSISVAILRSTRPRQWIKNLLVFAAPGAAGKLSDPATMLRTLATFAVFCSVAGGTYLLNDVIDRGADRMHPAKSRRPVAAGIVSPAVAVAAGIVMILGGIAFSIIIKPQLAVVVGLYGAVTIFYSLWLKREPVVELAAVASGFVLRAIAGGVATGVVLSHWFLIVASFGSLFMVAGKRTAELLELGELGAAHRVSLGQYTPSFLGYIRSVSSGVTITAYCLWAFSKADGGGSAAIWFELSIVPFLLALLRYAFVLSTGGGGAPEEVVLADRHLQVVTAFWLAIFAIGVYGG